MQMLSQALLTAASFKLLACKIYISEKLIVPIRVLQLTNLLRTSQVWDEGLSVAQLSRSAGVIWILAGRVHL